MSNSKHLVSRCCECGEPLYEGDTAYAVLGKVQCPGCVRDGEYICGGEYLDYRRLEYDAGMCDLTKDYNIINMSGKGGEKGEQGEFAKTCG